MKAGCRLLVIACGLSLTAPVTLGQRKAAEVKESQQRYESSAAGWRKSAMRSPGLSPAEIDTLNDIRFVYERSPLPKVASLRRFGERKVVVSDGLMSLVEDLIRADAISAAATPKQAADRRDCFAAFGRLSLGVARDNARLATRDRQARLRAVPRLSAFVNGRSADGCRGIEPSELAQPAIEEAVAMATDAALVWLLARQAALHMLPSVNTDAAPCVNEIADRKATQHAASIGVDALRAFPMVLAHAVLFDQAPTAATAAACSPARERVASFFQAAAPGAAGSHLAALRARALAAWPDD